MENRWAETGAEQVVANHRVEADHQPSGTLYVTAVGISRYPNLSADQQLQTPGLDARSFAACFTPLKGRLFREVVTTTLTDDVAGHPLPITTAEIVSMLDSLARKAGARDTSILFLAGHGISDTEGNYHFITADTQFDDQRVNLATPLAGTSFDWKMLHAILDQTMGRRVVVVDTCQAGTVLSVGSTDLRQLAKDVHDVNAIIYSGASRQQAAMETRQGGVFTQAILSGIQGKATYRAKDLTFLALKGYVDAVVPAMNRKILQNYLRGIQVTRYDDAEQVDLTQHPHAVVPCGMEDFVIYRK